MKVPSPKLTFWERIYLPEIARGLRVTIGHLLRNIIRQGEMPTVQFPEEPKPLAARHRSRHRLMAREDGTPKCVACMCCPTACPANCIHIIAEEADAPWKEKRPRVFEIDLLRCVFCGFCVEACPEDAIRMDTGEVTIVGTRREDFIVGIDFLMNGKGTEWRLGRRAVGSEPRPGVPAPPPVTPEELLDRGPAQILRSRNPAGWETPSPEAKPAEGAEAGAAGGKPA